MMLHIKLLISVIHRLDNSVTFFFSISTLDSLRAKVGSQGYFQTRLMKSLFVKHLVIEARVTLLLEKNKKHVLSFQYPNLQISYKFVNN